MTQEIKQYNKLLLEARTHLNKIHGVVEGLAIFLPDLEHLFLSILEQNVSQSWMNKYPSSTKLDASITDLCFRICQIKFLVYEKTPTVFWLSRFIVPSCFLTAVPRIAAERKSVTTDYDFCQLLELTKYTRLIHRKISFCSYNILAIQY